jgi:cyclin-dependent kinase 7
MRERDGFEGNAYKVHKIDEHLDEIRLAAGGNTSRNEPVPLSVDFSIFGAKPPNRPTINR